jgi:hypothetical protein
MARDRVEAADRDVQCRHLRPDDAPVGEREQAQLVGVVAGDAAVPRHVVDEQRRDARRDGGLR